MQEEFVDVRKNDKSTFTPEMFHMQLVMARSVAVQAKLKFIAVCAIFSISYKLEVNIKHTFQCVITLV